MNKVRCAWVAAAALALASAAAAELTDADAQYYSDFGAAAKRVGKQLDKLGDLFAKASSGKNYSGDCEERAADLADAFHFLEERVPPADGITAHKDLLASSELGAQAALALAEHFDSEFGNKTKVTEALDLYEQAIAKYGDALEAAPVEVVKEP
jgi:hypothetical protein